MSDKKIRKRTEEYYCMKYRFNADTETVKDTWIYKWTVKPPEQFLKHKTVFQRCTPMEINRRKWLLLVPAVQEIGNAFGIQKPESRKDEDTNKVLCSSNRFELLSLNHHLNRQCLVGVHDEKYVVAATTLQQKRKPFTPSEYYHKLVLEGSLRSQRYRAGYRYFQARFNTDYTFHTEQDGLRCLVEYCASMSVHGRAFLWSWMTVDNVPIPTPNILPLASDLSNLHEMINQANRDCFLFVQALERSWIREHGEMVIRFVRRIAPTTEIPLYQLREIQKSTMMRKCTTRLDVLSAIMHAINPPAEDIYQFIPLAERLFNPLTKRN
jgi:hypothetical protein